MAILTTIIITMAASETEAIIIMAMGDSNSNSIKTTISSSNSSNPIHNSRFSMETRPKHGTTHRTTAREMAEVVPVDSIGGKINDTSSKIQYC